MRRTLASTSSISSRTEYTIFHGRTALQLYDTPSDEEGASIEDRYAWCWDQSRGPVAFGQYGLTLPSFYDKVRLAYARDQRLLGILDHTQESGPTEKAMVALWIVDCADTWHNQDVVIGSIGGHILHGKLTVWNAPIYGYQPATGDYDTIEDAFAAGASVSWFGSWNTTTGASKQFNQICIVPGIIVAGMFVKDIQTIHQTIVEKQQNLQPFPKSG